MSANLTVQAWDDIDGDTFGTTARTGIAASSGPITFVNATNGSNLTGTFVASVDATAFAVTSGNLIFVAVSYFNGGSANTVTVTDTAGNTYTLIGSHQADGAGSPGRIACFYAKNITGHASNVVTANFSPNSNYDQLVVGQYSGLNTAAPLDTGSNVSTGNTGSTDVTSPSFSTSDANEVIIAAARASADQSSFTEDTGYTIRQSVGSQLTFEDKIVSATQSGVTAKITGSAGASWAIIVASFKQ